MKHLLVLEAIGDDVTGMAKSLAQMAERSLPGSGQYFSMGHLMPWVAELTGLNEQGQFRRCFLRGHKDYSEANSVGSRGVRLFYHLEAGRIYEVKERLSWKRWARYYCRVKRGGERERLTYEQAVEAVRGL